MNKLNKEERRKMSEWQQWMLAMRLSRLKHPEPPPGDVSELRELIRKGSDLSSDAEVLLPKWIPSAE